MAPPRRFAASSRRFQPGSRFAAGSLLNDPEIKKLRGSAGPPGSLIQSVMPKGYQPGSLIAGRGAGIDFGFDPKRFEAEVMEKTSKWYDRPMSVLGGIGRVLGVGENIAVGTLQSMIDDVGDIIDDPISPWAWYKGATLLDNYVEIAGAVKQNKTYEEWIMESADPDSFLYKNKFVIGLGLSILGDPTTYLSFGATGASKVAAQRILHAAVSATAHETEEALAKGVITATGRATKDFGDDWGKVFEYISGVKGRPMTTGDAMEYLRKADKGQIDVLDDDMLKAAGAKGRGPVRRVTRRAFARGGQGMRFAGMEIPGTRGAFGTMLDITPGAPSSKQISDRLYNAFQFMIPRAKLRTISEDRTRAAAMYEFSRANTEMALTRHEAWEDALSLAAIDPEIAAKWRQAPYKARAWAGIRNIFVAGDEVPQYVPKADRLGLLKPGYTPKGNYKSYLENMRAQAFKNKEDLIEDARLLGMDDNTIRAFERYWDEVVNEFDDPVDALARWQQSTIGYISGYKMIDSLVFNPLLARPLIEGAEDIKALEDEFADIITRSKRATKRVNEKGLSKQQKRARESVNKKLQDESERISEELKLRKRQFADAKASPQGPATEEMFRRQFQEDGVIFKHRGRKFLVPAAVDDALMQLKNPQLVNKEIKKYLRTINWGQNKWKIMATSVNPSFHVMNFVGAMWNNMLGGVYNPGSYVRTWTEMMRDRLARQGDETFQGRLAARIPGVRMDEETTARHAQFWDEYEASGVGGGFQQEIMGSPEYKEFLAASRPKGTARRLFTAGRRTVGGLTVGGTLAPDDWVPDEVEDLPGFNPMLGAALLLPEFARAGRAAANDVETTVRATPIRKALKDESYHQLMEAFSVSVPTGWGKWMGQTNVGRDVLAREVMFDIGAANALRYNFDYTDLTNAERYIAKTIFPFYVWHKNNFVLQAQELINRPRFIATANDIANYSTYMTSNEDNDAFREFLPEYFDKLGMFRVPVPGFMRETLGLPQDQDLYLNPRLPYASLNMFPPLWRVFEDDSISPTTSRMLEVFAPLFSAAGPAAVIPGFKPLLEYSIGVNLGLARPIDYQRMESGGWRNSAREAPGFMKFVPGPLRDRFGVFKDPDTGQLMMNSSLAYIAESMATPFMNSSGDVFNWASAGDDTHKVKADSFAFISGIRFTPVDPLRLQRGWLYRMQNFLEGRRGELRDRGQDLPPEDAYFLRQIRVQLKIVERAWDAQNEELYGG